MNRDFEVLPGFEEVKSVFHGEKGPNLELGVRRCKQDEIEAILELQQLVYVKIPDKDTFVLSTKDELSESLIYDICIGVFHDGRIIAFTLMVINRISGRNLACSLGLDEQICRSSVTYDTTFVDIEYRGLGLPRFLSDLRERYAIELGAKAAFATVSPENTVSLNNLLSQGFRVIDEKTMYVRYRRSILKKTLNRSE